MAEEFFKVSDRLPFEKINNVEFELINSVVKSDYIYEEDVYPIGTKRLRGGYDIFNKSFFIITGSCLNRRDWRLNEVLQWRYL